MKVKVKQISFEWDKGNLDKSYFKHGVTPSETEEIFVDEESLVLPDIKHSEKEERFIILGKTANKVNLFVVFTFRKNLVRVISARRIHKKEVSKYNEKFKNNTKI
jgi:hypothetical protein